MDAYQTLLTYTIRSANHPDTNTNQKPETTHQPHHHNIVKPWAWAASVDSTSFSINITIVIFIFFAYWHSPLSFSTFFTPISPPLLIKFPHRSCEIRWEWNHGIESNISPLSLFYLLFIINCPLKYYLIHHSLSLPFAVAHHQQTNRNATVVTAAAAVLWYAFVDFLSPLFNRWVLCLLIHPVLLHYLTYPPSSWSLSSIAALQGMVAMAML